MSPSNNNEHLPPWLRNVPVPVPPAQEEPTASSDVASETGAAGLPDWLSDLTTEFGNGDSPQVNAEAVIPPETPVAPEASSANLPSWVASPGADESDVASSDASETNDIPDWLRNLSPEDVRATLEDDTADEIAAEPFTFSDDSASSSSPVSDRSAGPPAWLTASTGEDAADTTDDWFATTPDEASSSNVPAQPAEPEPPNWLQGLGGDTPEPKAEEPSSATEQVPEWLHNILPKDDAANLPLSSEPAPSITASSDSDMPDWLRQAGGLPDSAESTPAPESAPTSGDQPSWVQSPSETSTGPGDEVPDWLRESIGQPASTPSTDLPDWLAPPADTTAKSPSSDEHVSDWLGASETSGSASSSGTAADEDIPDWLRSASSTPASDATPPAEDIPDWLRAPEGADSSSGPELTAAGDEVPDWLKGDSSQPATSESVPDWLKDPSSKETTEDVPDWLKFPEDATEPVVPEVSPTADAGVPAASDADSLPPWLRDDAPSSSLSVAGSAKLPGWLQDTPDADDDEILDEPSAPAETVSNESFGSWFDDEDATTTNTPSSSATESAESEFLKGTELPVWLHTTETPATSELSATDARSLGWLTSLGPTDDETTGIATPAVTRTAPRLEATQLPEQANAVALLSRLAVNPYPESSVEVKTEEQSFWQRVGLERILYVILLIALILGLSIPSIIAPLQVPLTVAEAEPLFTHIDQLTENDVVLIAYEWDARRVSELRPLEDAVIGHLIAKRVKMIIVSTDPQGSLLGYDLRDRLNAAGYQPGGQDYIYLGYRAGGDIALRGLAQNFDNALSFDFQGRDARQGGLASGITTGTPIDSLQNIAMTIVLADEAAKVQGWIEQVYPVEQDRPFVLLLPAEIGPIMQPYLTQPNIYPLAGKAGALAYEQLSSGGTQTAQIAQESGQLRFSLLIFALLVILGGLSLGIAALVSQRRKRA